MGKQGMICIAFINPDHVVNFHKDKDEAFEHFCTMLEQHRSGKVCDGWELVFEDDLLGNPALLLSIINMLKRQGAFP
ncbi:hypothetical protein KW796_02310 [Candidatus Parcubacteria bacterium]|nr:hypothetical protein [Candidatus Parcubacteria bacterium]